VDLAIEFTKLTANDCTTATTPLLSEPKPHFSGILPPEVSREAVEHYIQNEWALTVEDIMIRRTSWHYYYLNRQEIAGQVAQWMSPAKAPSPQPQTLHPIP
jgi:glycerol-3-phosphate dehydrogenase